MSQSVEQPAIEPEPEEPVLSEPEPLDELEELPETYDWFLKWI
jgi:hypothetical protein